jgi:hypothetical protein
MLLPGMVAEEETDAGLRSAREAEKRSTGGAVANTAEAIITCPNCGAADFDEDGDCAVCFEPGVRGH